MAKQGIPEKSMVVFFFLMLINRYIKFRKTKLSYVYVYIYVLTITIITIIVKTILPLMIVLNYIYI